MRPLFRNIAIAFATSLALVATPAFAEEIDAVPEELEQDSAVVAVSEEPTDDEAVAVVEEDAADELVEDIDQDGDAAVDDEADTGEMDAEEAAVADDAVDLGDADEADPADDVPAADDADTADDPADLEDPAPSEPEGEVDAEAVVEPEAETATEPEAATDPEAVVEPDTPALEPMGKTGWQKSGGATYYLIDDVKATGWQTIDGKRYYFSSIDGHMLKGNVFKIGGESYCFGPDGALVTGWVTYSGDIHYFDPTSGAMVKNCEELIKGLCAPILAAGGSSFTDVNSKTPHDDDIDWMLDTGISAGWVSSDGKRTFQPLSTVKRADMAAFLYRLAGSPDFIPTADSAKYFRDVTPETPHANEIWWLAGTGISEGWEEKDGSHTFRPMSSIVRQDMAAFLYRLAGSPSYTPTATDKKSFTDVNSSTPHATEIWWLASEGISEGWTESNGTRTFRPLDTVKRADMAAFLHREVTSGAVTPSAEHTYRFDSAGRLVTGWSDGSFYDLTTGARVDGGWVRDGSSVSYIDPGTGKKLTNGLRKIAGWYYLFNSSGNVRHGWIEVDGSKRYFGPESGAMYADGIYQIGNDSYCFNSKGNVRYGWVSLHGSRYYFDKTSGKMLKNGTFGIDGTLYKAGSDGKMVKLREVFQEMFRKAQNYSSSTGYLVLVNCSDNYVVVYRPRNGIWVQDHWFRCTSGKESTPTIKGVFYAGAKGYSFSGDGHTCYYYTQIYGDFLIHSVLFHEGTFDYMDGRLGVHASLGCVRLALQSAKWVYDNVPTGSTIVTY